MVKPVSEHFAENSDGLASRAEQQAAVLQQAAASMEQITATVLQNSDNALQVNQLYAAYTVLEIISIIDEVTFQSSILALNASIEMARADIQGHGFAVVAQEVRNLASRSAKAAAEVRVLIEGCCHEITQGGLQVSRAEAAIAELVTLVHQVNNIVGDIANASDEQRRSIEQINIAVAQLDQSTHNNSSMAVESSHAAHILETQVAILANSIGVLRLGQQALSTNLLKTVTKQV